MLLLGDRNVFTQLSCLCVVPLQPVVVSSPKDLHVNHGEHPFKGNSITTAQFECFQQMTRESLNSSKTMGQDCSSNTVMFIETVSHSLILLCIFFAFCRTRVQRNMGWVAVLGWKWNRSYSGAELSRLLWRLWPQWYIFLQLICSW